MKRTQTKLKAALMAQYSAALDELLAKNEAIEDFGELEEAVDALAKRTLPQTVSTLQAGKDFSPDMFSVSRETKK